MNTIKDFLNQYNGETLFYVILAFLALNYIVALYKSRKGTIVAISNWFDLFLVTIPALGFIVLLFLFREDNDEVNHKIFLYYGIVSIAALFGTLLFSIVSNKGNLLNVFISFFSKLFVVLISAIMVFYIFGGSDSKKDGRYKDNTKGNTHTKWKVLLAGVAGFLIFSLVGNKKKNIVSTIGEHIYKKG